METVPTLKEMGLPELQQPEDAGDSPGRRAWMRLEGGLGGKETEVQKLGETYKALNGILFLTLSAPTLLSWMLLGADALEVPHYFVMVWVHEAGHGFWCLLGHGAFCSFSGFFNEMLVTVVPAMICLRDRRTYYAACVLLMFAALSVMFNGAYMRSAENPSGTSFAGVLTHRYNDMTVESHDWSVVFRTLGIVEYADQIGAVLQGFGFAAAVILLLTSVVGLLPMLSDLTPRSLIALISPGAAAAAAYFILLNQDPYGIAASIFLSLPLLWVGYHRITEH